MSGSTDPLQAESAGRARRAWSLRRKAWVITLGVLLSLAALLALGVDRVFRQGSNRLETRWVEESVRRLTSAQNGEVDSLERSGKDYATWTDTYDFMTDRSRPYVENNLQAATFSNLQLDAFLLFDPEGNLQLGRVFRDGVVTDSGVEALGKVLSRHAQVAASGQVVKGLTETPAGIALFAALPIFKDNGTGPSRGAHVQIRFLDEARIKRFCNSTDLDLSLRLTSAAQPTASLPQTRVINDHQLEVTVPLLDVEGRNAGEWVVRLNREIHLQGVKGRLIFYAVMTVLILAAAVLMGWMLRAMVISRLESLHQSIKEIEASSDLSARLPVKGADELASVSEGINHMLDALERGEEARTHAESERERLNKQLQEAQKLEAIGTLTGGLAHDFNNLLTSIQGSATLLRLEGTGPASEEHLKRIEQATGHAARLVRQMMAFGRRAPTVVTLVQLPVVVREALQLVQASLPRSIDVQFFSGAVEDYVSADAAQLQQVIVNLATNAAHAMPDGQGVLKVSISETTLPDETRPETARLPEGEYLRLEFSDTGSGIPPEVIPRIFEPFFTTKPVGSGTGLGLAVVHGIINQHHGSIGVESEVGKGTTFILHLPRVSSQPAQATPEPTPINGHRVVGEAGSILLVDDDSLVRETLEAGLKRMHYRITCAAGGAQALKLIRENRGAYDAVITDQMMPGMTGTELGEIVAHENPGLPLILVTGFASALNEPKVKAMGFSAMLMKPVTIEELDGAVRQAKRP